MKTSITTAPAGFQPVSLTITAENAQEAAVLRYLLHRPLRADEKTGSCLGGIPIAKVEATLRTIDEAVDKAVPFFANAQQSIYDITKAKAQ